MMNLLLVHSSVSTPALGSYPGVRPVQSAFTRMIPVYSSVLDSVGSCVGRVVGSHSVNWSFGVSSA